VRPSSLAAESRSTSASYFSVIVLTASNLLTLAPVFATASAYFLPSASIFASDFSFSGYRARTRSTSVREKARGFFSRWSRTWSSFGRMPVTWQDMHETPASTARSGRFGSLTMAIGPLSSRVLSAFTR